MAVERQGFIPFFIVFHISYKIELDFMIKAM